MQLVNLGFFGDIGVALNTPDHSFGGIVDAAGGANANVNKEFAITGSLLGGAGSIGDAVV